MVQKTNGARHVTLISVASLAGCQLNANKVRSCLYFSEIYSTLEGRRKGISAVGVKGPKSGKIIQTGGKKTVVKSKISSTAKYQLHLSKGGTKHSFLVML